MKTPPRHHAGFTWLELLVCLGVLAILASLGLPNVSSVMKKGLMTQTLSHMKQLHLATQQMALDGATAGDSKLGWPGDLGGSFSNWSAAHVPSYLGTNDFCKLLSAPGKAVPVGRMPQMKDSAILVYAVRKDSPDDAVFLTTANFTNTPTGGVLDPNAKPYGGKGFTVFHKSNSGQIFQPKQAGRADLIGSFAPLCQ